MSDNTTMQEDAGKIDADNYSEVEQIHQQFPHMEHQQVLDAVKQYGPDKEDIIEYLKTFIKPE